MGSSYQESFKKDVDKYINSIMNKIGDSPDLKRNGKMIKTNLNQQSQIQ